MCLLFLFVQYVYFQIIYPVYIAGTALHAGQVQQCLQWTKARQTVEISQKRIFDYFGQPKRPKIITEPQISQEDSSQLPGTSTAANAASGEIAVGEEDALPSPSGPGPGVSSTAPAGNVHPAAPAEPERPESETETISDDDDETRPANMDPAAPAEAPTAVVEAVEKSGISLTAFDEPFQPLNFNFPGRRFGNESFKRSFTPAWFKTWKWLHYVAESDSVLCFSCVKAVEKKLIRMDSLRGANTFVHGGFANWRKAKEKFKEHEKSWMHNHAVEKHVGLKQVPINALLSTAKQQQQQTARNVLELLFRTISFLGSKGVAFRGDTMRDGILYELMLERTFDKPDEHQWMLRRDNWMSNTVQNEIIQQFAHAIQRDIVSRAEGCNFYGLTADGTTDTSTTEQFSINLQFVDSDLQSHCLFLGFYNAHDSTGLTLFNCIKDVFLRLNIPIERVTGYCFDGASNMSGCFSGVQARMKEMNPQSLYVHCSNHSLDLVLQEVARDVSIVADTLNFVQSVAVVIRESSKRKQLYESLFGCDEVTQTILGLCPTRWCVRTTAIKRVSASYSALLATLDTLKDDKTVRGDARSKIGGLYKQALKRRTFFGILCCEKLFEPCEAVAKTLQSPKASALGALQCANSLKKRMESLKNDDVVKEMISKCSSQKGLETPADTAVPRVSKTPARYRQTKAPEALASNEPTAVWQRSFYEAVQLVLSELNRRFNQDSMQIAANRELAVMQAAAAEGSALDLGSLQLPREINTERLDLQLQMLGDLITTTICKTVQEVATRVSKLHPQTRALLSEAEKLMELCLSLPISVASSERTFSALRRLKTWLRSTMTQQRLTHLALMHVHPDILKKVDIHGLMRTFISTTSERRTTFGLL